MANQTRKPPPSGADVATAEVASQIRRELIALIAEPFSLLLGKDLYRAIVYRIEERAPVIAVQLVADDNPKAEQLTTDLMYLLWGPAEPNPEWWTTPLGGVCARHLQHPAADAVSYQNAAVMLNTTRADIIHLVKTGKLEPHPDGGITRTSIHLRQHHPET